MRSAIYLGRPKQPRWKNVWRRKIRYESSCGNAKRWHARGAEHDSGPAITPAAEDCGRRARGEAAGTAVSLPESRRLPAFDGIRALAISLVLLQHLFLHSFEYVGPLGVSIFLVLSGFLITRVMLIDEQRAGSLRLRRFYYRRAWRILPVLYVFLLTVALLSLCRVIEGPSRKEWLACLFFFRDVVSLGNWQTGHLWSLSLEEQFYFCWPVLFMVTRRFRLEFIAVTVVLMTVARFCWVETHTVTAWELLCNPLLRMDTFLIGGAFAMGNWSWPRTMPAGLTTLILAIWTPLSLGLRVTHGTPGVESLSDSQPDASGRALLLAVSTPVSAFLLGSIIVWVINSDGWFTRACSARLPVWIGHLSYSIYLWQQLFLGDVKLHWWTFPALLAVSCASYYLIERPSLRMKDSLKRNVAELPKPRDSAHRAIAYPKAPVLECAGATGIQISPAVVCSRNSIELNIAPDVMVEDKTAGSGRNFENPLSLVSLK
jgi:peptidoglycan/LPS O-acetylase OafA/YrhL